MDAVQNFIGYWTGNNNDFLGEFDTDRIDFMETTNEKLIDIYDSPFKRGRP